MITELQPGLDRSMSRQYGTVADHAGVTRTAASLEANAVNVLRAADAEEAKRIVLGLIPHGSEVDRGASRSVGVSGITGETGKSGRYEPLRPRIWSMDGQTQADGVAAKVRCICCSRVSVCKLCCQPSVHTVTLCWYFAEMPDTDRPSADRPLASTDEPATNSLISRRSYSYVGGFRNRPSASSGLTFSAGRAQLTAS